MSKPVIRSIMTTDLVTVESDHSFNLADGVMRVEGIRHLPVVEDGRLIGLVTHRDIARAQASFLSRPTGTNIAHELDIPVGNVMQTRIRTVTPDTPVVEAARLLSEHKFGCLPVVEEGRLVGIVTDLDFIDLLVDLLESPSE